MLAKPTLREIGEKKGEMEDEGEKGRGGRARSIEGQEEPRLPLLS